MQAIFQRHDDAKVAAAQPPQQVAVSPDFAEDRTVFAYVSTSPTNRVVALRIAEDLRSLRQERVVLDDIVTANQRHGGQRGAGLDGNLWITTGDRFSLNMPRSATRSTARCCGFARTAQSPPDNPFDTPVWSIGHCNVQGITFGPDGTVYAAELGLNAWDELNVLQAGADYGWPNAEGPDGEGGVRPNLCIAARDASPSGIAYAGVGSVCGACRLSAASAVVTPWLTFRESTDAFGRYSVRRTILAILIQDCTNIGAVLC